VLGEVIVTAVVAVRVVAVAMVILREADAVCPFASVTAKVKALVPELIGVPDKTPAFAKTKAGIASA